MTRRRIELALWVLTLATALWGRSRWLAAVTSAPPAAAPVIARVPDLATTSLAARLAEGERAAAKNPFRLDRGPAPVAFAGPPGFGPGGPPPPSVFRPPLAISGMIGPPWVAVLEGVPGHENGVVVRGGERFGDLRVRSVSPGAVTVSSSDTTWRLTVRSWQ